MRFLLSLLFLLVLAAIQIRAARYSGDQSEYEEWQEFKEFQRWKHTLKNKDREHHQNWNYDLERYNSEDHDTYNDEITGEDPPPIDEAARMARYIVNQNNWTSIATISTLPNVKSFPFVNVASYSDGPLLNGTGMPYLYITPLDYTAKDLSKDSRATLSMTLAEGDYCASKSWDPMDPRCARVYLTGKVKALKNTSAEFEVARNAVFGRHPALAHMPADHHFFFVKLKIIQIALLDTFGGPKYITPKDYFAANQLPQIIKNDVDTTGGIYDDASSELKYPQVRML